MNYNPETQTSQPQSLEPEYSQKTRRLTAYGTLLRAVSITSFAIAAGLLVLMFVAGTCHNQSAKPTRPIVKSIPVRPVIRYDKINQEILSAVTAAHDKAMKNAGAELDAWQTELMGKAETDFADDWYFRYFAQQGLALSYAFNSLTGDADTKLSARIQTEFSARVMSPPVAALRFQRIADNAVTTFVTDIRTAINQIPAKYAIPAIDFERYLADAGKIIRDIRGNRSVPLSGKAVAMPVAYGGVVTSKLLYDFTRRVIVRVSAKLAARSAETVAARAGTAAVETTAGIGVRCIVPLLTVGIIAWEYCDHKATVRDQKPVLLRNIRDLLGEMRETLLNDPQNGVMGILTGIEDAILSSLPTTNTLTERK